MLASQIILISRKFLHFHTLELSIISWNLGLILEQLANEIDGIPMLDTHEWTIHALSQKGTRGLHIGGRHPTLQELKIRRTFVQRIVDDKLDKPFRLRHELLQRDERSLVLHVGKLGQMLGRVRLLRAKTLLAGVHLPKTANGRFQWQLTAHRQSHIERLAVGTIAKHVRAHVKRLPRPLAITHRHNIGIRQLHILAIHKQMHGHIQLAPNAKHALRCLRAESVEGKVAQTDHLLFGALLDGIGDGIEDVSDDADAGGLDFKVLRGRGRREDNFAIDDDGAAGADVFRLVQLFEC
mmetsp:Transcript_11867/g.21923  ORF Transcript_11867/g.21923 Transcript_11867/m.21923 type:complete len:295 (+) Transcript_11867:531-1415(+)